MGKIRIGRSLWIGALVGCVLGATAWFRMPKDADYCNVALVPALAVEIGADLPTRLWLAQEGADLLGELGHEGPSQAGPDADRLGRARIEDTGKRVYERLSVKQRKAFHQLLRGGGIGPDRFDLSFGWKGAGLGDSLSETRRKLDEVWQTIPSVELAQELQSHPDRAVTSAAERWLARHEAQSKAQARRTAPAPTRTRTRTHTPMAPFEERVAAQRAEHEERVREIKARHEERVAEMKARHAERVREMRERQARR